MANHHEDEDQVWHSYTGYKSRSEISLELWERCLMGRSLYLPEEEYDSGLGEEDPARGYLLWMADHGHLVTN